MLYQRNQFTRPPPPKHFEVLSEIEGADRRTVFRARWHSFFTAQVPAYVAQYHQVEHDNDYVYLLQMTSSADGDQYCLPDK